MEQWGSSRKWSKWANALFKKDKPLGSEPWFNPEAVTEQKREWMEQRKAKEVQAVTWPEHIYENFFIVGLPPDMELTQVAEQLCELERKKQRSESDNDTEPTKEHLQPPQPSFTPQVLLRLPPGSPALISDDEVAAFCFPSGVAPEKLKRTPSLSALDELVMGRDSDQQQQCFVFMLKVGDGFPLYGCCWYVREMLHRPPYLARQQYRSCRAPFRQCMIAAPRCYCLLSHYPFFDLHFRVLKIVLDLERLERLLEYDTEKSKLRPPGPNLLSPSSPKAHSAAAGSRRSLQDSHSAGGSAPGSGPNSLANSRAQSPAFGSRPARSSAAGSTYTGGSSGGASVATVEAAAGGRHAAGAGGSLQQPGGLDIPARRLSPDADLQAHVVHNRQQYCAECAVIIESMCPFTPGADGAASAPSWSQWQQQRRRANSPLGPDSSDQGTQEPGQAAQQWQQQLQQEVDRQESLSTSPTELVGTHSTPSVAVCAPARCEVCGKRLRMSTPETLVPDSSCVSAVAGGGGGGGGGAAAGTVAANTTADAAGGSSQLSSTLVSAIAGVLPARISAVLQPASSTADQENPAFQQQQQQQAKPEPAGASLQFDAVAVAAADFDAAGSRVGSESVQGADQWSKWQDVVSAVRGAHSQQQPQQPPRDVSHGRDGPAQCLQDTVSASAAAAETSMVQRMWETWAPKALEASASTDAGGSSGVTSRLSGGLGLFKRVSRPSGTLADPQAPMSSTRTSSFAAEQGAAAPEEEEQQQQPCSQDGLRQQGGALPNAQQQPGQVMESAHDSHAGQQRQQVQQQAGHSIQQVHHLQHHAHQQGSSHHSHSSHGPSRLRPDVGHALATQHEAACAGVAAVGPGSSAADDLTVWQSDPNLRPLRSYKGHSEGGHLSHTAGPDLSTTSNATFYSVDESPPNSILADWPPERPSFDAQQGQQQQQQGEVSLNHHHQQDSQGQQQVLASTRQQQEEQQVQQVDSSLPPFLSEQPSQQPLQPHMLPQRGKSEVLLRRHPSPPPGQQLPLVQLQGRRQQRWSDPASWPSRPRTPSPLPLLTTSLRGSHHGRASGDGIVSAFAAIAAAAEPFEASVPRGGAHPSVSSSLNGAELCSSTSGCSVPEAGAAAGGGPAGADGSAEGWDSRSQGRAARVNVTIGGGVIPSADSKLQLQVQQPSRAGSGRRSALFEEVALRRSGDMSNELRMTISHLVQVDSGTLLAAYYASPVPQPGETYRLMLGDLYRLEFERCLPLQQYAPPGRSRLRQQVLTYAEVECAQHLQLWSVAALCRSLSVDNIITLVNAVLLEKQLVVFCPHIGTLGSVVLSLVPLLRPFTWQSLMMPVTPVSMLGFLDAPVPFVLGVQYKTPDVAGRCHGLMRVNVYKDAIKNASFPTLPNTRQLAAALAPHHAALCGAAPLAVERPVHVITPDEEEAARSFLGVMHDYLSKLCGDLRPHTIVNVGMSKRTGVFMKESLLESLPAKDRPFMRAFMETQMFSVYADGVISDVCEYE